WHSLDRTIDIENGQIRLDGEYIGQTRPEMVTESARGFEYDGSPSPSGHTNNGYVPDASALSPEFREFLETNPDLELGPDGVVRPTEPIYVEVNGPTSSHPYEHYRQAAEQQAQMREYSVQDLEKNIDTYNSAAAEVRDARASGREVSETALRDMLADQHPHLSVAEIDDIVRDVKAETDATHRLDGKAGGDVTDISGLGHQGANRSLGGKWPSTTPGLLDDLRAVLDQIPPEFRGDVRPNIVFVVKP
nr:hypothetical protein [Actinomycetales bacterium]